MLSKSKFKPVRARFRNVKPLRVGELIQARGSAGGYGVVKDFCGHGIGSLFHCAPNVPHYARNKAVGVMQPGMTFTIEPMLNEGTHKQGPLSAPVLIPPALHSAAFRLLIQLFFSLSHYPTIPASGSRMTYSLAKPYVQ